MSDSSPMQLVVFSLGGEEYALPIGAVHEIIRYAEPRAVASSVPWVRGVIGLRGKIIPVFDLAARMGLEPTGTEPGKIVIVSTGAGQAGVIVDDVDQVLTVSGEQLEDVTTAGAESIQAIAKIGDRLVVLLNAHGDVLVSLGLGSCIGLALIDRRAGAAGLAHVVLPEATGRPAPETLNKFADHAVPALFERMRERGASRVFMEAVLVGGASMFGGAAMEVGLRNAGAVRSLVAARRVPVVAEAVGGTRGRTIRVDVAGGGVTVREAGGADEPLLDRGRTAVTA